MRTPGADAKQHQNVDDLTLDEMVEASRSSMLRQTRGGDDVHFNHEEPWSQTSSTLDLLEGVLRGHRLPLVQVVYGDNCSKHLSPSEISKVLRLPSDFFTSPSSTCTHQCEVELPSNRFAW